MFWGWAQTDPAGIHASSAPGHGRWARRRPTNTRTHLVIDAKPNANPDAFRLQEHRVHVLGLGVNFNTFERQSERFQEHQRKLTLRGFTHPQLQDMDALGGLTRPGIPLANEKASIKRSYIISTVRS
ncbi:hypothetical protein D9611_006211 [Ephemerocybe angulata]|uniref:Uncharacterized protein n=1 Tax=Ephemerocybe angulata TaxID=980116 RepID=A0A8H5FGZ6_9AGAR|nr:hypothetical protein D9611_006211 [Tulosesus angulatus]